MNEKKDSTYGLSPEKLTRILSLCAADAIPPDGYCDDTAIAAGVNRVLSDPIADQSVLCRAIQQAAEAADVRAADFAARSACDLLADGRTPLSLLNAFKLIGKQISYTKTCETESAVGVTLYYGAIAAAVLHHHTKITRSGYDKLADAFDALTAKKWMAPDLKDLFAEASGHCHTVRETGHDSR
jgi:hypothetical protein